MAIRLATNASRNKGGEVALMTAESIRKQGRRRWYCRILPGRGEGHGIFGVDAASMAWPWTTTSSATPASRRRRRCGFVPHEVDTGDHLGDGGST